MGLSAKIRMINKKLISKSILLLFAIGKGKGEITLPLNTEQIQTPRKYFTGSRGLNLIIVKEREP